jgi:phytoene desaturase
MSEKLKVIVVGSGVAGMAEAIRLAVKGYTVTVYEKNDLPGGKLTAFEQNGFRFDAGPSLFTQPQNVVELFALAGEPMEQYFSYKPVDIACKYFFENGKQVNAFTDAQLLAKEMQTQLGESPKNIERYLGKSKKAFENVGTVFVDHSLHKRKTWFHKRIFSAIANTKAAYLFKSLHSYNQKSFDKPETVQIFNRFATYNGSNPFKAPGMLSLIPHLEQNEGTFYPKGGMISITNALFELAKAKGVKFVFNTEVKRIIYHEGKVRGVVVNNMNVRSDIVVSNMDIYFTYLHLLNNPYRSQKVLKQERSSSALIFYWSIDKIFDQLQLHNIFFSEKYKEEFDCIFNKKTLSNDPTVYINITSKMEEGHAPTGKENWFVMVNAPANYGQAWEKLKAYARQQIILKINRILGVDIEPLILHETTLDPVRIEANTSSYMGSLYGSSSNSKFAAFLRHPNFKNTVQGLYFVGGSVHPGGGIPLCLKSAKIVSDMIDRDIKRYKFGQH